MSNSTNNATATLSPLTSNSAQVANGTQSCQALGIQDCIPGLYCPRVNASNPLYYPVKCLPTPECETTRLLGHQCPNVNNSFGATGPFEPVVCPPGYYCSTPKTIEKCPAGHFCPTGTVNPRPCDTLAFCPEGKTVQKSLNGVVAAVVLDILLLIFCFLQWRLDRGRRKEKAEVTSVSAKGTNITISSSEDIKQALVGTFKKAMNGKSLKMDFSMQELGFTLPSGKTILKGVSGEIHSGRMTAIIGPSGAGKTTFMNVLCGKVTRTSGKLLISKEPSEMSLFKKICGFVPQDDVMYTELTVRENILHSARIRLPSSWSEKDVSSHVDNILLALNLSHVAHSIIGDVTSGAGISGGQRKRVNVAMELAAAPLCLCLDEPTSGLDSTAALELTDVLSKIAGLGMTIVAVVHQPRVEIFRKFDDVLMIVPGGRTAYFGPAIQARDYFEQLGFFFVAGGNEADTLMDILSGHGIYGQDMEAGAATKSYTIDNLVQMWIDNEHEFRKGMNLSPSYLDLSELSSQKQYHGNENFHDSAKSLVRERGATFFMQIWHCVRLSILQQYRTIAGLVLEIAVGTLAGLLMGMAVGDVDEIYQGIWKAPFSTLSPAPIFFLVAQFTMMIGMAIALSAAPAGTKVFSEELAVYWRAASSGLNPLAYYLAKTLGTLPRIFLAGTHFSGVLYFLSAPVIPFWVEFLFVLFFFYGVYGLCAFVSMVVKRENATLLSVVFSLFSSVFCGYGPTLSEARRYHLLFVWQASYAMYATEAHFSETLAVYDHVYENSHINDFFGFTLNHTVFDLSMMVVIGTIWRIFAFIAMVSFNREKQR